LKNAIVAMKWHDKLTALKLRRDARMEAPGSDIRKMQQALNPKHHFERNCTVRPSDVLMLEELKNAIAMEWRDKLTALKLRRDANMEAPGHQKNAASLNFMLLDLDAVVPVDNFKDAD
jgi:hypothetical protein